MARKKSTLPDEVLQEMNDHILMVLANSRLRESTIDDYAYTFRRMEMDKKPARKLAADVVDILAQTHLTLSAKEELIAEMLDKAKARNGTPLRKIIENKVGERAEDVANQVTPHLRGITGEIVDIGCGDAQVAHEIARKTGLEVTGVDVVHRPAAHVTIPVKQYNGRKLPFKDKHFQASTMLNVAHHIPNTPGEDGIGAQDNTLNELTRVTSNRAVLIETVPVGITQKEISASHEMSFMNDYFGNRIVRGFPDVNVPGTFRTVDNWVKALGERGWKVNNEKALGNDQKTIKLNHHRIVVGR